MLIVEVPGLTAGQKQALVEKHGFKRQDGLPFETDRPKHTVTLENSDERRAAVSGILAYDYLHADEHLPRKAAVTLPGLVKNLSTLDSVVLWPGRNGDAAVVGSMYWAGYHADSLGSLTLSAITEAASEDTEHDNEVAHLAAFVGSETEFACGLEIMLHHLVQQMRAENMLAEIEPAYTRGLPPENIL